MFHDVFVTIKVNMELLANYVTQEAVIFDSQSFSTRNRILIRPHDWGVQYDEFLEEVILKAEHFQEHDSGMFYYFCIKNILNYKYICVVGWPIQEILFLDLNINKYTPIASTYQEIFRERRPKNDLENCFAYSVNAAS